MWLFKFGVPMLGILGFVHAAYEVFSGKEDHEKMGLRENILRMFGVADALIAVCWLLVFIALMSGGAWARILAIFATGMFFFDYLVALPIYENIEDGIFKYWAGAAVILQVAYCIWL
jgi:4-hydroxybenzoate polyprenyltransferase